MEKTATKFVGLGVLDVLGVAFVVLKLCGVISWSWWAVLAPLWVPVAILAIFLLAVLAVAAVKG